MRRWFGIKKAGAAFVALGTSAGIAWASCGGTEALVNNEVGHMATALVTKLSSMATAIVNLDNLQTEYMVAGIKVATKQVQNSTEKYANATIASEKAMAHVQQELGDRALIDQVVVNFMSQGFNPCVQSAATKQLAAAEASTRASVADRMATEVDAIGGHYASRATTLRARERMHESLFCTQEEVDAGMCSSVGKIPGGDSNAALIFNVDQSADMVAAKNAVINNIVGLPDDPLSSAAASTPQGQAYLLEKKQKDAFLGFAAYSLKSIQTETEQYTPALDARIGQFFGTPQAADWAKDQASESQRGIMVDLVKIQGLQLKLHERKIRRNLRIEANLAALLEEENQRINGAMTTAAAERAASLSAVGSVK